MKEKFSAQKQKIIFQVFLKFDHIRFCGFMFSCTLICTFKVLIGAKQIIEFSVSFHQKCLGVQGHSTRVAVVVVIRPVVAIDMEPLAIGDEVHGPSPCSRFISLFTAASLFRVRYLMSRLNFMANKRRPDKPTCGLGASQDNGKKRMNLYNFIYFGASASPTLTSLTPHESGRRRRHQASSSHRHRTTRQWRRSPRPVQIVLPYFPEWESKHKYF